MLINQVADKYNVSLRTLRYYEKIDLLHPSRNSSNIREFCDEEIKKLELVLVLKLFNFSLSDIKEITYSRSNTVLNKRLLEELNNLDQEIIQLSHKKQLIHSLLNTFGSKDISKQNIKEFIDQQMYFSKDKERFVKTMVSTDKIILEISPDLIPLALDNEKGLIPNIQAMREQLESDNQVKIDKIRIRDNELLSPQEYRIINEGQVMVQEIIDNIDHKEQTAYILDKLKGRLVNIYM